MGEKRTMKMKTYSIQPFYDDIQMMENEQIRDNFNYLLSTPKPLGREQMTVLVKMAALFGNEPGPYDMGVEQPVLEREMLPDEWRRRAGK